jgi:hypothetical protein
MNANDIGVPVTEYWNLTEAQRQTCARANLIGEDEYQVLMMINAGRQIVAAERKAMPGGLFPTMMHPDILRVEECIYYDAIAQLLAAAMKGGFEAKTILSSAIEKFNMFVNGAYKHSSSARN